MPHPPTDDLLLPLAREALGFVLAAACAMTLVVWLAVFSDEQLSVALSVGDAPAAAP